MRALAEYAMRGRIQAVTVAAGAAALPLCFWISAATVALVALRKGWVEGLSLLLWAALPAALWLFLQQDPTPIVVIAGAAILAITLRLTVSWVYTLLTGVLLGIIISYLMPLLLPEVVAEVIRVSKEVLEKMATNVGAETGRKLDEWLNSLFAGMLGAIHLMTITACLMLGRWWQSVLYNPGGFGGEFRALIIPKGIALILAGLMLLGGGVHPLLLGWLPVLTVPFLFAAIALVHGVVALRKLGRHWLVGFYVMVVFMGPYFYVFLVVLAILDSMLDIRDRIGGQSV